MQDKSIKTFVLVITAQVWWCLPVAKPKPPSYRDFILTNCPRSFQNSYYHKLVLTVKKLLKNFILYLQ